MYTKEYLSTLDLNERQVKAVLYVKEHGKITNKEYQELNKISKPAATLDLQNLVSKGLLMKTGSTGRGTSYTIG